MEIDLHLGSKLRRRRRQLGLTQAQVAEACGLAFQQIQKYECAASRMSAARLWQLCAPLNVAIDYFFDGLPGSDRDTSPGTRGTGAPERPTRPVASEA
jgi:transcriptional regulator with XRE-family HTH domain